VCPSLRSFRRHLIKCYSEASETSHTTLSLDTCWSNIVDHPNESDSLSVPMNVKRDEESTSDNDNVTSYALKKALVESSLVFVSNMYASSTLNRIHIQEIIDSASELLTSGYLNLLKTKVVNTLQTLNCNSENLYEISCMFDDCENIFDDLQTDYQRIQAFKDSDCYVASVKYIIGNHYRPRVKSNQTILNHELDIGQYVPMKEILKCFIQLLECFKTILLNSERLNKTNH